VESLRLIAFQCAQQSGLVFRMTFDYRRRRQSVLGRLPEPADGLLVVGVANVRYLTGFTGDSTWLLLSQTEAIALSDKRYAQQLAEECPDLTVRLRPVGGNLVELTAQVVQELGWQKLACPADHIPHADWEQLGDKLREVAVLPVRGLVEAERACKDPEEIASIRHAITVAERALLRWLETVRPSDTEKTLADRLELLLREEGAECGSFPVIVAADERAAHPHARARRKPIGDCEVVLVDWGADCGYKSDLTRVFAGRTISPRLRTAYQSVRQALERALAVLRPGIPACQVHETVLAALADCGFGEYFLHSTGHGIGLEVHEQPILRPGNEQPLQPGMVLTIEPGLYFPEWGGVRLEQDILITNDGCELLSQFPCELQPLFR
jgi:Xaa-Pro aminopeptidase